jgi:hypothetical protein
MRTLASFLAFGAAITSFSRLWQGVRAVVEGDGRLYGSLEALWWMGLFLASMAYLAFVIYAADRAAGRAKRTIPIFERVLNRGRGGRTAPSSATTAPNGAGNAPV